MELNLTAQNKQEELVLKYLQNNASETLADKINNGTPFEKDGHSLTNKKTLAGFMKFACDEARKLAEKGANSTFIDNQTVYGWAIHFFEEDSIEGTLYTIDGAEYKPTVKRVESNTVKSKPEPKKQENVQFSFFDNLTEQEVKEHETDNSSVATEKMKLLNKTETMSKHPLQATHQTELSLRNIRLCNNKTPPMLSLTGSVTSTRFWVIKQWQSQEKST